MRRFVLLGIPAALIAVAAAPRMPAAVRSAALAALLAFWTLVYLRYRRHGQQRTRWEWERLAATNWQTFWRHYNEQVPTVEEEYELWGPYHEHRHEMRYDIVAGAARPRLLGGGRVLDVGCGSANVADRLAELDVTYVGMEFAAPPIAYSSEKYAKRDDPLHAAFAQGDAERLPFADESFDVVVMSEVIEHLLRPDRATWEVARCLRPGGLFVMSTNNASEIPLRSPLSHPFAYIEKVVGASVPEAISLRPWVWPHRMDPELVPDGAGDVYLPHTHHISAETRRMFAAAGLRTRRWGTFEFPPPQSRTAAWLERQGPKGLRIVDAIEAVARRTPGLRRLGTHLLIVAEKTGPPVAADPPSHVWPGPFS